MSFQDLLDQKNVQKAASNSEEPYNEPFLTVDCMLDDSSLKGDVDIFQSWNGFLGLPQTTWNLFFVFLCVAGQVAQNVTLPIWFASVPNGDHLDPLFILTFAGLCFCIIFGILTLIDIYFGKTSFAECIQFTTPKFLIRYCSVGVADALNGIFLVFAADSRRTPAGLQSMLGILMIYWTILFRFMILKKSPSLKQFVYACMVFVGLVVASLPTICDWVPGENSPFKFQASGAWKLLWPVIFGCSFAPAAVMNVVGEDVLKEKSKSQLPMEEKQDINVNVWYFLTWESVVQELTFLALFWMDALPTFGTSHNVSDIFSTLKQDWRYFFALDGAKFICTLRAIVFVAGYTFSYIGTSLLLRYTEGATWAAIVGSLVMPIGTIFWFFFELKEGDSTLYDHASWDSSNWYILLGLVIMSPFMYLYNMETKTEEKEGAIN